MKNEIKQNELIAAMKFVQPAMPKRNDVRYFLNGVCIDAEKGLTTLVATNGHMVSVIEIDATLPKGQYIVPRDLVNQFLRIFKSNKQTASLSISITVSTLQITFSNGETTLGGKLIDGNYPDWRKVFDEKIKHKKHYKDQVGIQTQYLKAVGDMGKAINDMGVRLKVVDPNEAMRFDFDPVGFIELRNPRALIMPMKI